MSDAVDVQDDARGEYEERPTILPPPTLPAALLADARQDEDEGAAPPPAAAGAPAEPPRKPYLLVRLGHRLCGFRS